MSNLLSDLTLPEFAFLSSPELAGRNVMMHVRSATVVEFFHACDFFPKESTLAMPFSRLDRLTGRMMEWTCALHFSPLLNAEEDAPVIREIMSKAVMRFCDWLDSATFIIKK